MGRGSDAQKAERLNRTRLLLRHFDQLPEAVGPGMRSSNLGNGTLFYESC
jgi:hypothetical protein